MRTKRTSTLVIAIVMLTSACFGGSGDSSTDPSPAPASTQPDTGIGEGTGADAQCNGGAFPNDPEFRQLLCDAQNAQLDVMRAGGEFDDSWISRQSDAILKQATDRAAAVAEMEALIAEMRAAG